MEKTISDAIASNDIVIIHCNNAKEYQVLDVMDSMTSRVGKTLSNGCISYKFEGKSVFVGDINHPSLRNAFHVVV